MRRQRSRTEPVELGAVHEDDRLLDRLGAGRAALSLVDGRHGADATSRLLAAWRNDLQPGALPPPLPVAAANRRLRRACGEHPWRPMVAVVAAITLLLLAAAGIGSRTARPGDTLWPLTQIIWHSRADSVLAGQATRTALDQARLALAGGDRSGAILALTAAAQKMDRVQPLDGRDRLRADYDELMGQAGTESSAPTAAVVPAPAPTSTEPAEPAVSVALQPPPAIPPAGPVAPPPAADTPPALPGTTSGGPAGQPGIGLLTTTGQADGSAAGQPIVPATSSPSAPTTGQQSDPSTPAAPSTSISVPATSSSPSTSSTTTPATSSSTPSTSITPSSPDPTGSTADPGTSQEPATSTSTSTATSTQPGSGDPQVEARVAITSPSETELQPSDTSSVSGN